LISWSPNGEKLISTHFSSEKESEVLSIWNAHTGALLTTKEKLTIGSWSPDGKEIAVYTSAFKNLQIVDADKFQVISEFPNKTDEPFSRSVSWIDHQTLVGAKCVRGDLCRLWRWNRRTNDLLDKFEQDKYLSIVQLVVNHSGNLLAVLEIQSPAIDLWDTNSGKSLNPTIQIQEGMIDFMAWHPSKDILAIGASDGSLQIWEIGYSS
jgi:WD40 repeat protein